MDMHTSNTLQTFYTQRTALRTSCKLVIIFITNPKSVTIHPPCPYTPSITARRTSGKLGGCLTAIATHLAFLLCKDHGVVRAEHPDRRSLRKAHAEGDDVCGDNDKPEGGAA